MIEFKEGKIVVIIEHTNHAKIQMADKYIPHNLVTEMRRYPRSETECVLSVGQYHYGIEAMVSMLREATLREAFLYHLKGKPFIMEEE